MGKQKKQRRLNRPYQGTLFAHPSIGEDLGLPTNDCGKNWTLFLQTHLTGKRSRAVIGSISAEIVRSQVEAQRNLQGPDDPGTIRGIGILDEVLKRIADKWKGR